MKGADDADLERHVRMIWAQAWHVCVCRASGVGPTNNASERVLRYYVVFRKIMGQTGGSARAMRRLGDFVSCVVTWWNKGKSVMAEVAMRV